MLIIFPAILFLEFNFKKVTEKKHTPLIHRDTDHNSLFNSKEKIKCHKCNDKYRDNIMSWESSRRGRAGSLSSFSDAAGALRLFKPLAPIGAARSQAGVMSA